MELPMKWHKVVICCPQCRKEATLVNLSASADGEILIGLVCIFCAKELNFKTNIANLVRNATISDIEDQKPKRLQPPLKQGVTKAEQVWLHACGIEWKEGDKKWQ